VAFDCRSVKSAPDDDRATHGRRKAWIVPAQLPCARWGRAGRCDRVLPAREARVVAAASASPANGGNPERSPGAPRG